AGRKPPSLAMARSNASRSMTSGFFGRPLRFGGALRRAFALSSFDASFTVPSPRRGRARAWSKGVRRTRAQSTSRARAARHAIQAKSPVEAVTRRERALPTATIRGRIAAFCNDASHQDFAHGLGALIAEALETVAHGAGEGREERTVTAAVG